MGREGEESPYWCPPEESLTGVKPWPEPPKYFISKGFMMETKTFGI
jgi:hypothetical protein